MTILSVIFILAGVFFLVTAAVGVLRMPDFYTRSHAAGIMDTLGILMLLTGIALYLGWQAVTVKTALIFIFFCIINPTVCHALQRAALRSGLRPWTGTTGATPASRTKGRRARRTDEPGR